MSHQPLRNRTSRGRAAATVGLALVSALALAACEGGGGPVPVPQTTSAPTETPEQPAEELRDVSLEEFEQIDRPTWDQIVADPNAAEGRLIVVYAQVTQFDSATGPDTMMTGIGVEQPAGPGELRSRALVTGDPEMFTDVRGGDSIRVHAEVMGTYGNTAPGTRPVVELRAYAVEPVGYRDLSEDVTLGAAVRLERGGVEVPVSVLNTSDVTMEFRVDVVAESEDGTVQLGTTNARVEYLAPGQSAQTVASFRQDLPASAVVRIVNVTRTPTDTL